MICSLLFVKIQEVIAVDTSKIYDWYRSNKKDAIAIIASLDHLNLEPNTKGRVQFRQVIWHYKNNIFTKPICENDQCSNFVKWNDTTHKYQSFCSNLCSHVHGGLNAKRKETMLSKYGIPNAFSDVDKMKQARLDKFGSEHALQNKEIAEKMKETNTLRYGADHPWKNRSIRAKCVESRSYGNLSDYQLSILSDRDIMVDHLVDNALTQSQLAEKLNVAQSTVSLYAREHGIDFAPKSKVQLQIQQFIEQYVDPTEVSFNNRDILSNGYELDIVVRSMNFAIEVNGVFWHGELNGKHRTYHLDKKYDAADNNLTLLQIFDVEWNTKRDIVESRIRSAIGVNDRIFARKCAIVELDTNESREFFTNNHIQGFVGSTVCYALMVNDIIVAAMSFGKSRFNSYQYELLRYCSVINTNVVGGASKLFSHFIKEHSPSNVVSFGDMRWGNGALYSNLGFECVLENTGPNYYYFDRNTVGRTNQLFSRLSFQKHKLNKKLVTFNPELSEWENMKMNGYDRIWDCGSSKWVWTH